MKLNHIALNINNTEDITDFYQNILSLELVNQFELPKALSQSIFGINLSLPAYFCKNEHISIEMFVLPEKANKGVAHICLEIPNREQFCTHCQNKGYKVNTIKREGKPDLIFVWDKAGNCFEIKEEIINK